MPYPGRPPFRLRALCAAVAAGGAVVLAAVAVTAWHGDSAPAVSLPSRLARAHPALATPVRTPVQEVTAAYESYWQALTRASDTRSSARASALLAPFATAAMTRLSVRGFERLWRQGYIASGTVIPHLISVRITSAGHASVRDCPDFSHDGVMRISTGAVVPGTGGRPAVDLLTILVLRHGRWLVSDQIPVMMACAA